MIMLSDKELTKAIQKYARKHGWFARTVRTVSSLRFGAIREYKGE